MTKSGSYEIKGRGKHPSSGTQAGIHLIEGRMHRILNLWKETISQCRHLARQPASQAPLHSPNHPFPEGFVQLLPARRNQSQRPEDEYAKVTKNRARRKKIPRIMERNPWSNPNSQSRYGRARRDDVKSELKLVQVNKDATKR